MNRFSVRAFLLLALALVLASPVLASGDHSASYLRNPLDVAATVTSGAMYDTDTGEPHHVFFGPEARTLAMDVATSSTAGKSVYFRLRPLSDEVVAVRGRVIDGGKDHPVTTCRRFADGGYRIRIAVEHKLQNGAWMAAGWVTFAHLESLRFNNNAYVQPDAKIGVVANEHGGSCSSRPHLHIEATTLPPHASGYYDDVYQDPESISSSERLLCIGGSETEFESCDW